MTVPLLPTFSDDGRQEDPTTETFNALVEEVNTLIDAAAPRLVVVTIPYDANSVDRNVFVADRAYTVTEIRHVVLTQGSDPGTMYAQLKKCTGTQAPASGATLQASQADLKFGVVNSVSTVALTVTTANLSIAAGNRIAVDFIATAMTGASGLLQVTLEEA